MTNLENLSLPGRLRRPLAAVAAGAALAGTGIGWAGRATSWMDLLLPPQMGGDR